jgi:pimeloyl-ACP methyl ester carboxylesterase
LADAFHLVAPDYPGFGHSEAPDPTGFDYTFDNIARIIERFTELLRIDRYNLFVQDYGGPVGFRLAAAHPDRVASLVIQNAEGTFLLCTFWLAQAQALAQAGRPVRARAVFERAVAFVNEVGLLAEEVDPLSGELFGNFPQAFSHIGRVNAAWAICESEGQAQPT